MSWLHRINEASADHVVRGPGNYSAVRRRRVPSPLISVERRSEPLCRPWAASALRLERHSVRHRRHRPRRFHLRDERASPLGCLKRSLRTSTRHRPARDRLRPRYCTHVRARRCHHCSLPCHSTLGLSCDTRSDARCSYRLPAQAARSSSDGGVCAWLRAGRRHAGRTTLTEALCDAPRRSLAGSWARSARRDPGGHAGGHNCQRAAHSTALCRKTQTSGAEDTRNVFRASRERKTFRFAATSDAGGGTRTPDTRIMIPLRFGSTAPFAGAGGHKRGQIGAPYTGIRVDGVLQERPVTKFS